MSMKVPANESMKFGCFIAKGKTNGIIYKYILTYIIELVHFSEKPDLYVSDLINCGVYLFSAEMYNKKYYIELE